MTDYTKITDFAAKDTLPTGSAGKIIRGSEFETEFDNISTAIATKADANGGTLTNVDINSGTIDGTAIGANSASTGAFSSLTATTADIDGGTIDGTAIGANSASTGAFSSLTATTADIDGGTIDGTNIGATTAGTAEFTSLTAGGLVYPTSDGTAGQVLTTDGAGTLSLSDAVIVTHTASFTASGAVSANSYVVLDGINETVTEITGTLPTTSNTADIPTSVWGASFYNYLWSQFFVHGPTGKKIISNGYSNIHVVDMSGTVPTVGSNSSLPTSATTYGLHWNPTESRLIVIQGDNIYSGSISGTTITWSSGTDISSLSGTSGETRSCFYDPVSQKSILVWAGYEVSIGAYHKWENIDAHVLTLDGSGNITVESGTSVMVEADLPSLTASSWYYAPSVIPTYVVGHPGQSTGIIGWSEREGSTSSTEPDWSHRAKTFTVSGTTISVGSTENSLSNLPVYSAWQPQSVHWDSSSSDLIFTFGATYTVFSVSGSSVSCGTPATLELPGGVATFAYNKTIQYNSTDDEYSLPVYTAGRGYGVARYTWDGSSFTLQNTVADIIDLTGNTSTAFLADFYDATYDKYLVTGRNPSNSSEYLAFHYTPGSTTLPYTTGTEFRLCYALESGANGETVKVQFGKSVIGGFTGLTPGASYFVDHTGSPNQTMYTTESAGSALTATKMLLL